MINLYEIYEPTVRKSGRPIRKRFHKIWDNKVKEISGGMTILHPVKGKWTCSRGTLYEERMIPVRIACTNSQMKEICDFTAKYYEQLAVMYYKISNEVNIINYTKEKITCK